MAKQNDIASGKQAASADSTSEHLKKRRRVVKRILTGGGIAAGAGAMNQGWQKPIVNAITLPAHAAGSPPDTTPAPTTTVAFTTSFTSSIFATTSIPIGP